ncbi:hypothetical protein CQW23_04756 [Capsicum baccatum]|uniref:Calmodulin-binding domain-containing protein n=1 Tax=Capsicum baccatum TaxID=33114 RepID=A0A2G2XFL1_CAPBA|nr:hypothetical protein CQW23_04756 [Capsicum baccatum]
MKSSSKILGGVDVGGKKHSVVNYRKQIIMPKVSTEKSLKMPTLSSPLKSFSVNPLILRVRNNKSLKLLAPLKDQNKMRRDVTNKLNPKMDPEKTLRTSKVKASPKSSSYLQSRPLSNEEDKNKVVKTADSALDKYTSSSKKLLHIEEVETIGKNQKKTLRKGKTGVSKDNNFSTVKLKFRRGKIVDLQQEISNPRRVTFRWGRHVGESQDNNTRKRIFKKKGVDGDKSIVTSVIFADCGGLEEIDLQATKLHEFECFFNNRVRFYFSSIPVLEHVKISLRGDASMPYIFGEFAANLPAQVKSLIVTAWNTQVTHFPTEMQIFRNPRMLVLLFESTYNFDIVKVSPFLDACPVLQSLQILGSGMMAEDNSNELASPVTSVNNDSMAEDNTNELVSPVTNVKNDSAGSKPDKISTIKPRSMSNGNKVLPYYRSSSSTSSYNVGNTKRQSTGKLNALDCGQNVIPHYLRASTGSCHDFCKYGRKYSSEAKPWHPLSKRKNKLPADEQSPARTLVGEARKGALVKQKLSTLPGNVLGEKKKVTGVEQKPSNSPGSMLGESKKRTVVMQKTSTTSRSNQSDAKKGILVKKKLSTPPVNMLEEGKKVNEVYQKPLLPQGSVLKDEKEVTMVEQKPSSPPGCMEGGIDEVTMVEQKSLASLVSMLGEGENVIVVEQKLSTPPGSMLVKEKKEAMVNQKPSAPPESMRGQGKKLNVVDRRPSPKVHSLEPSLIKKKKILLTLKSVHSLKLDSSSDKMPETEKKMKSSSKILGGVDAGGKKDSVGNYRKQIIAPKVSAEKYLKTPTLSCPLKSSFVKPLILRIRSNKSLKLLAPLKDQNKTRRDGTNKLNLEIVPEKTLRTPKVKASPKSSSHLQSRPLSNEEDKKEVVKSADSALGKSTSSSKKLLHIAEAETVGKKSEKDIEKRKIVLRHHDVQEKKDVQGLLNNVIEDTASNLVETGKSKVKALVGAFDTVISLHNKPSAVTVS